MFLDVFSQPLAMAESIPQVGVAVLLRMIFIWGVLGMMRIDSQNIGLFYMPEVNLAMVDYLSRHFFTCHDVFVAAGDLAD